MPGRERTAGRKAMVRIDRATCIGCGTCADNCTQGAISVIQGKATVDQSRCTGCGVCLVVCGTGAVREVETSIPLPGQWTASTSSYQPGREKIYLSNRSETDFKPAYRRWQPLVSRPAAGMGSRRGKKGWNMGGRGCRRRFRGR